MLTVTDSTLNINGGRSRLVAIIGPGDSSITMQTHNILQLFEMPQIGYSATAKQLSDKEKFKYFTRVIASDTQQAQAIVDIIRQFKWSYVATIGTEGKINNKKNQSSTTLSTVFNDLDGSEFKDDQEEYTDDLEDDAYYNEPTVSNKISSTSFSTTRYPYPTTRQTLGVNHTAPIWILFNFLTRPPIAAGILAGLAIGIFTSIILLICIIRRYHKREKSHSSYTTGLLYPNQYGYSKSPQEFYA